MHPRAVAGVDRLGHEGCDQAVPYRDGPHDEAEAGQVVGHRQRLGVAQVDLMLADGDLVMAGFDDDAELLERLDHLLAHV